MHLSHLLYKWVSGNINGSRNCLSIPSLTGDRVDILFTLAGTPPKELDEALQREIQGNAEKIEKKSRKR
jgi:hypothetical protein